MLGFTSPSTGSFLHQTYQTKLCSAYFFDPIMVPGNLLSPLGMNCRGWTTRQGSQTPTFPTCSNRHQLDVVPGALSDPWVLAANVSDPTSSVVEHSSTQNERPVSQLVSFHASSCDACGNAGVAQPCCLAGAASCGACLHEAMRCSSPQHESCCHTSCFPLWAL